MNRVGWWRWRLGAPAALLTIAAGLKSLEALAATAPIGPLRLAPWMVVALVVGEIGLALWLLRRGDCWARGAGVLAFGLFAGVAGWLWWSGQTGCGCFGVITIHPGITLVLDLVMVLLLALPAGPISAWRWSWVAGYLIVWGSMATGIGLWLRPPPALTITDPQSSTAATPVEDDRLRQIRAAVPVDLASGEWVLVIYRDDCDHCRTEVPRLTMQARREAKEPSITRRWIFLGIGPEPPRDNALIQLIPPPPSALLVRHATLFVTTPLVLRYHQGRAEVVPIDAAP